MKGLEESLKKDLHPLDAQVENGYKEINVRIYDPNTNQHVGNARLIPEPDKNQLAIESLNVESQYQGLGIGKIVARDVVDSAQKNGYDSVGLWAERDGTIFWPKAGFAPTDETQRGRDMLGRVDYDQTFFGWKDAQESIGQRLDWAAEDKTYPQADIDHVKSQLSAEDPKSLWVLIDNKQGMAQELLQYSGGVKMNMKLDFHDPDQMQRFQGFTENAQVTSPQLEQQAVNKKAADSSRWLVNTFGDRQADNSRVWEAGGYTFTNNKGDLQVTDAEGKTILQEREGKLSGSVNPKDLEKFEAVQAKGKELVSAQKIERQPEKVSALER
jgi:N-acetylglutamate synthase-like GNAT family acetyltransferase